ncbi:MAG: hypothetical protein Q4D98_06945 [Planctomycetia bacterium]|nr:hypothetical protein [Planctomycetia bacterium]
MQDYKTLIRSIQSVRAQSMKVSPDELNFLAESYVGACRDLRDRAIGYLAQVRKEKIRNPNAFLEELRDFLAECRAMDMEGRDDWSSTLKYLGYSDDDFALPGEELRKVQKIVVKIQQLLEKKAAAQKEAAETLVEEVEVPPELVELAQRFHAPKLPEPPQNPPENTNERKAGEPRNVTPPEVPVIDENVPLSLAPPPPDSSKNLEPKVSQPVAPFEKKKHPGPDPKDVLIGVQVVIILLLLGLIYLLLLSKF